MDNTDRTTLLEMQRELGVSVAVRLDSVAERLLRLRDNLGFDDSDWYHQLTQHIATLDSGSTFRPANAAEKDQLDGAVQHAIREIKRLIQAKLA
jgi:hypothetical protein